MRTMHGLSKHPLYSIWKRMRQRCNDIYCEDYPMYGGRGIKVSPEWDDFRQFLKDMGDRPKATTLDRIDNDKGYSKDNCRWAIGKQQLDNRRKYKKEKYITFANLTKTVREWIKFLGILQDNTVLTRIYCNNWGFVRAVTTPRIIRKPRKRK